MGRRGWLDLSLISQPLLPISTSKFARVEPPLVVNQSGEFHRWGNAPIAQVAMGLQHLGTALRQGCVQRRRAGFITGSRIQGLQGYVALQSIITKHHHHYHYHHYHFIIIVVTFGSHP
jgi:hypothetical protein